MWKLTQSVDRVVILGQTWWYARGMRKKGEAAPLCFDLGLINEHDGQTIANRINPKALRTFQALGILAIFKLRLAGRTNHHFEKVFRQHNSPNYRRNRLHGLGTELRLRIGN